MQPVQRVFITVAIIGVCWLIRWALIKGLRHRHAILDPEHRRTIGYIRQTTLLIIALTVAIIWFPQIQHFALSITAIAVAVVVATKELIACFSGALMLRTTGVFRIGDWIRVSTHFGEVIEENVLNTVIQEIDPGSFTATGRTVSLPNSLFLTNTVINQNFLRRYQFHNIRITVDADAFPMDAEDRLLKRIEVLSADFQQTADRYNAMLEKRTGIDIPDAAPQIEFSTTREARLRTTITVFCPTDQIVRIEKGIMREFFNWYRNNREFTGLGPDRRVPD